MTIRATSASSPAHEQIGWLMGGIRIALDTLDSDVEGAKRTLLRTLEALEGQEESGSEASE